MKNYIKSIMTAALLLVATGTWADNVVVINQLNGTESEIGGTVTVDKTTASGGETVTITVEPATGYYLDPANITVVKTIEGSKAQTRAPGLSEPLTVTHASGDDVSGEATYTFVMPTDIDGVSYDVEVTVNFSQRTSITDDATVTATGTFTYSGKAIVPETITVKLVSSNTTLTKTTDYTLAFADNTNQGTATITATGVGKYAGTATGTFTINPKEVKNPVIKLSQTSFDYDGQEHMPTVTVYDVDGTTEIPASEYNVAYQKKTSDSGSTGSGETGTSTSGTGTSTDAGNVDGSGTSVVTKEEGTYTVVVTDKKGGNYTIATATADYEIKASSLYAADGIWIWTDNVTIVAQSKEKTYDGTSLEGHDTAFARGIPEGFSVSITASGLQTDAGESDIKIENFIIYNSRNEDVTSHFTNITTEIGKLIITPAPLTVQTGSASKTYDGTPLTNPEAAVAGLVEGEKITVTATGSQTDAGESENTFEIKWDSAKKSNYIIIEDLGTLTVETKEVKNPTINLSETSFNYDGQEHKPTVTVYDDLTKIPESEYNVSYQKKASDSGSTGSGEIKEPGTYIVTITDKEGGNYTLGTATAEFKIVEDENTDVVVPPTPIEGLVYNGQPQALVKAGSVSKLREMQYRLSSENAWSTEIPVATNAGEYEVEYWAQAINALAKDLTSGYVKVTIAPKELKEENFFIGSSKDKITNASLNPYPVVDSVTVVLIEGDQPIKLQEGTDYTFDYFGADNQWIAEDELYMDKNQNKSINLVVTGKGNYSGEVRRSFTNTLVISSFNELTNTATITGLANSEATTVVIPSTVAANGRNYPVTSLKGLGIEFPGTRLIDLTDFNLKNLKENPLEIEGGALEGKKVKVLPETLAFFASNPSLRTNVENGQLYADLKADYYLQTFSCGIDITIPGEKKITYVVGKDTVNLGTIRDITEYLKFYKCTVKENDGKDEVFVSSIHDQMKDGFRRKTSGGGSGGGSTVLATSLLYEANNGVLIACDTTSVINLIEQVDVASIADQVDLKSLATALGYGALVKYAPEAMLKQYVLNNADLIKKKIKEQFRSTAATLVAQYTKDKPIATGDVKTYGLDNMLVPVTESTHFDATDEAGNTYYILYDGIFHKINDNIKTEVSACKAVLKVPASMAKSRALDITEGDDDTTVISAILAEGDGEARWYNLNGQRIEKPTKKGLYILNGHKVVVK